MNPVRGYTMLNFMDWLADRHPELPNLRNIDADQLLGLANEFEGGKLSDNGALKTKWRISFEYLLRDQGDWEGYGEARKMLG
jgi:hypothetical protein